MNQGRTPQYVIHNARFSLVSSFLLHMVTLLSVWKELILFLPCHSCREPAVWSIIDHGNGQYPVKSKQRPRTIGRTARGRVSS